MPVGRIKRLELLSKIGLKSLERINERISKPKYKGQDKIMLSINNQKNAMNSLNSIRQGKLTGTIETPESIVRKLKGELKFYSAIIEENLKTLGYGKIMQEQGIEKALETFFAEMDKARLKE